MLLNYTQTLERKSECFLPLPPTLDFLKLKLLITKPDFTKKVQLQRVEY